MEVWRDRRALVHEQMRRGATEADEFALDRRRACQQRYFVRHAHFVLGLLVGGRIGCFACRLHRRTWPSLEYSMWVVKGHTDPKLLEAIATGQQSA